MSAWTKGAAGLADQGLVRAKRPSSEGEMAEDPRCASARSSSRDREGGDYD